ncbi:MAG: DUF4118 domain-containing protein [Acidobacteriota bacterium]|nr:DUF4118 domain-containing protein [Acidobacteriota bacterium]
MRRHRGQGRRADLGAFLVGFAGSAAVAVAWVPLRAGHSNVIAAMALVVVTTAAGALRRRPAVIGATASAALSFIYFDTVPFDRMTMVKQTDIATAASLVLVGLLTGELSFRLSRSRKVEDSAVGYLGRVADAAALLATGEELAVFIGVVADELASLLGAASSRYSVEALATGSTVVGRSGTLQLPPGGYRRRLAVPVLALGESSGHFALEMSSPMPPDPKRLRVAITLADQVGAALAAHGAVPPPPPSSRGGVLSAPLVAGPRLRVVGPDAEPGPPAAGRLAG